MSKLPTALAISSAAFPFFVSHEALAQLADRKILTLEGAKQIAAAADAEAKKNSWNVVIAIVDDYGNLIYFQRADDTQAASNDVAIGKARTAAMFRRPTKAMEEVVAGGRHVIMTFPGAVPVQGGLPLVSAGKIVGAIGVSGVTSAQDEQIAKAGVDILAK
jgi:glc operon protein GlcG